MVGAFFAPYLPFSPRGLLSTECVWRDTREAILRTGLFFARVVLPTRSMAGRLDHIIVLCMSLATQPVSLRGRGARRVGDAARTPHPARGERRDLHLHAFEVEAPPAPPRARAPPSRPHDCPLTPLRYPSMPCTGPALRLLARCDHDTPPHQPHADPPKQWRPPHGPAPAGPVAGRLDRRRPPGRRRHHDRRRIPDALRGWPLHQGPPRARPQARRPGGGAQARGGRRRRRRGGGR